MSSKPVQISLDIRLLGEIDADPEAQAHGRSAFIRNAARAYLRSKEQREVDRAILGAYADCADQLLRELYDLVDPA